MIANFVLASVLLSCITGATSSIVIKHNYYDKVHYIESGPRNYAFVGIGSPQDNFKGITVNDGQLVVERGGCDKRTENWGVWTDYLKNMLPSYSNMVPTMVVPVSSLGITESVASVPTVTGMTRFSHKNYKITAMQDSLDISAAGMPMNLIKLMFINDMVVFIYSDRRIETSAVSCLTQAQQDYVRSLQASTMNSGIQFNSVGALTYDSSKDGGSRMNIDASGGIVFNV